MISKFLEFRLIVVTLLILNACASGSAIVTGKARGPIDPKLVILYLEPPVKYETIGLVNASSDSGFTAQGDMDYAVEELKNQAAKIGANGILLISSGITTTGAIGNTVNGVTIMSPTTAKALQGKAIYVEK